MHGLVNRSIQCFLQDTYGDELWHRVARGIGPGEAGFEAMLTYENQLTLDLVDAAGRVLDKPEDMLLEDVGTYLVSHPNTEAIRRLLRFGGESFSDFLHSLDDLPDRARLAVPELDLPAFELVDVDEGRFELRVCDEHAGYAWVLVGVLRAMADDYGALAYVDYAQETGGGAWGWPTIRISLLDSAFAEGRSFTLARPLADNSEVRR